MWSKMAQSKTETFPTAINKVSLYRLLNSLDHVIKFKPKILLSQYFKCTRWGEKTFSFLALMLTSCEALFLCGLTL